MVRVYDERAFEFRFGAARLVKQMIQLGEHDVISCVAWIERDGGVQFRFSLPGRLLILCERVPVVRMITGWSGREPHGFCEVGGGLCELILLERRQSTLEIALRVGSLRRLRVCG